jgi:hypothetical protein
MRKIKFRGRCEKESRYAGVSSEALPTFRKNGTRNTNPKTENNDTRRRESAYKETERRRV